MAFVKFCNILSATRLPRKENMNRILMRRSWTKETLSEGMKLNIEDGCMHEVLLANQMKLEMRISYLESLTKNSFYKKINVNACAADFKIYSYLQKRVNEVIKKCPNATNDIKECPDIISIVEQRTHSTFFDKFKTLTIGNISSDISVFIGADDDLFNMFLREVLPGMIICRIQSKYQMSSHKGEISRAEWGFQYNAPDLSNDNITAHIDDVLERVALEKLARVAEALPKQGKGTEGILTEVKELFTESQVPMPDWMKKWEPDKKSIAAQKRLEKISEEVLTLPYVFACGVSNGCIQIMLLRKGESKKGDLLKRLNDFGLSHEEYNVSCGEIKPCQMGNFEAATKYGLEAPSNMGHLEVLPNLRRMKLSIQKLLLLLLNTF